MNGRAKKKVGVKDIALAAGVSIGTVDRVLHNRGEVKAETKKKVMAIVEDLGYKPNVLARTLSSKKTTRIAIVIPDSSDNNPYWQKPVHGIGKASEELASYNVEIIYEHFDASDETSFKKILEKVCAEQPDGIVLNPVFKSVTLNYISIFNQKNIPYVFIDVNIKGVGKLGYFGQDAEQSGLVSAKLMKSATPRNANLLIVKISKNRIFSEHIVSRESGFKKFYKEDLDQKNVNISTIEIDIQDCDEPAFSLDKAFKSNGVFDGIFVPNSRVFKVANYIKALKNDDIVVVGFDLVDQNIEHLKQGTIDYLISQKPEEQAYKAIMSLFDHLITKKEVQKTTFSPIDIIINENIDYYK